MITTDPFSELSAEKFRNLDNSQVGNNGMMFVYQQSGERPSPLVGLWLTDEFRKQQVEQAHYVTDTECNRALRVSGAWSGGVVWLGLQVEMNETSEATNARIVLPKYLLEGYDQFSIDPDRNFVEELGERFSVWVVHD